MAKRCNRNIGDTIGLVLIGRIHKVYIRDKGLSKKKREEMFKTCYPELHQKMEDFRHSKKGQISKGVQITALKKILCMSEIPEAYWDEILDEVQIYREINESKIRSKPFLKMYYYCFVPRLRQIHRRR